MSALLVDFFIPCYPWPQATEGDQSEDEDLDDAAMMKLDGSIATLFAEQKKRMQAKKDERDKLRKEKVLIREFKIKVGAAGEMSTFLEYSVEVFSVNL